MTNTTKFYEIVTSKNTWRHEEHVVFFTTIDGVIDWLKAAGATKAHDTCNISDLWKAKWYGIYGNNDFLYDDVLTKTYSDNSADTSYRVLERTFEN